MKRNRRFVPRRAVRRLPKEFAQTSADVLEQRVLLSATAAAPAASASTVQPASAVEPIGGTGNNVAHPTWGAAGNDLLRLTPAQYANGINSPSLPNNPSARLISNLVNSQADPADPSLDTATVNQQSLSDFVYSFGQFMDHDMDLTQGNGAADNISVPAGDPIGGPNDTPLYFNRSQTDPATGTSTSNPAQQVNSISSYFDLSQIYGSDQATDNALRTFSGGQMKTSPGGLPPLDNLSYFTAGQLAAINASVGGMADQGPAPQSQMFVTGDTRGNENVELTVLQALFLDNHNRLAATLQKENPTWTDQQLFNEARKLNIAQYQSIIYNEWIPAVMGANALPAYKGYNPNVNASIANEFSTVAFRFGHSLLSGDVERQGNNGQAVAGDVPLAEDFFDPYILNGEGQPSTTDPMTGLATTDIGAVLKGDADGDAQAEDVEVINEVRNELFNEVVPGVGYGQDLISLDIQRGRDNGIGSYNEVRESLGLPAVTSFAQITSNVQVQKELEAAYGTVNNVDAIEGGMAEDPVAGSDVGPLFQTIMANQFARLRDGDRFFYLNETFTPAEQALLNQGNTLTKVIEANTNITNLQSNAFIFQASIGGTVSLNLGSLRGVSVPGLTVQLEDTSGDVLATTTTDKHGYYSFNQLSGPSANVANAPGVSGTGTYEVVLSLPSWLQQTGRAPQNIVISHGGQNVSGMNFSLGINWNALSTSASSQTASALAALDSSLPARSLQTSTASTANLAATDASQAAAAEPSTSPSTAAASTTTATSGLTPESLLALLESIEKTANAGTAERLTTASGSASPPPAAWTLDSAFEPTEFAKIAEQLG